MMKLKVALQGWCTQYHKDHFSRMRTTTMKTRSSPKHNFHQWCNAPKVVTPQHPPEVQYSPSWRPADHNTHQTNNSFAAFKATDYTTTPRAVDSLVGYTTAPKVVDYIKAPRAVDYTIAPRAEDHTLLLRLQITPSLSGLQTTSRSQSCRLHHQS